LENEWEPVRRDNGCNWNSTAAHVLESERPRDHVHRELSTAEQNDLSAILGGTADKDTPEELRREKRIEETEIKAAISPLMPPFYALSMSENHRP
jgi:hypothetical protein